MVIASRLRKFLLTEDDGVVLLIFAIALLPIVVITLISMETGIADERQDTMKNACIKAALTTATHLKRSGAARMLVSKNNYRQAKSGAVQAGNTNYFSNWKGVSFQDDKVVITPNDDGTIDCTAKTEAFHLLSGITKCDKENCGDSKDVSIKVDILLDIAPIDMVIMVDTSRSMTGYKIDNARVLLSNIVKTLMDSNNHYGDKYLDNISIAVVPFSSNVSLGDMAKIKYSGNTFEACVDGNLVVDSPKSGSGDFVRPGTHGNNISSYSGKHINYQCPRINTYGLRTLGEIISNKVPVSWDSYVNQFTNINLRGNTDLANAMSWGIKILDDGAGWSSYGSSFKERERRREELIIIITDSINTVDHNSKGFSTQKSKFINLCDDAKNNGRNIMTIAVSDEPEYITKELHQCAGGIFHTFNQPHESSGFGGAWQVRTKQNWGGSPLNVSNAAKQITWVIINELIRVRNI